MTGRLHRVMKAAVTEDQHSHYRQSTAQGPLANGWPAFHEKIGSEPKGGFTMYVLSKVPRSEKIRRINDYCRTTFTGCLIVTTATVAELDPHTKALVLHKVRTFKDFDADNDPHHEHDMAFLDLDSERYWFKFDYYAPDMEHGADDPSDIEKTRRVLTIGHASDY